MDLIIHLSADSKLPHTRQQMISCGTELTKCIQEFRKYMLNRYLRRLYGKRRPGIGKRPQYAYLKLGNTRIHSTQTFTPR